MLDPTHRRAVHGASVLRDSLRGGVWLVVATLTGLVTFPVVARLLGREALGAWQLLVAASMFVGFADLGLSTAVERATVRGDADRTRRAVGFTLSVMCGIIPVAAALSYGLVLDVLRGAGPLRADAARAGLATIAAGALFAWAQPYRFFLVASGQLRAIARGRSLGTVVNMAVAIALLSRTHRVLAPALGQLAGAVADTVITVGAARRLDPRIPLTPSLPEDRAEALAALRDGSAGFSINLAAATALRVDLLVISRVADLATVAAYGVGGRAVETAFLLAKQSVVAITPRLGSAADRSAANHVGTMIFGGVVAAGLVALAVVGQGLVVLWAGPVAAGPVPALAMAVLGLGAFIASTYAAPGATILLGGRSAWVSAVPVVVGSACNLAISLTLSPTFGVWAVAWSTVAGNLVTAVLTWRVAVRMLRWSPRDLAHLLALAAAPGVVALAVSLPLRAVALRDGLSSMAASGLVCLVGLGVIVLAHRQRRVPESVVGT